MVRAFQEHTALRLHFRFLAAGALGTRRLCNECVNKGRHHHSDKREPNILELITHGNNGVEHNAIVTKSLTKTYCQSCKQGAVDLDFEKSRREGLAFRRARIVCLMVFFVVLCIGLILLYVRRKNKTRPSAELEEATL